MPIDPAAKALLDQIAASDAPALNELSPAQAREMAQAFRDLAGEGEAVSSVLDRTLHGPHGEIPVRVYTPSGDAPFPGIVYYHGGGWVVGDLEGYDAACRALCNAVGAVVVSVDYRLAPEHKFPTSVDDCFAVLQWVANEGRSIGIDVAKLAVAGDSAGGNLAAAATLKAKYTGGPPVRYQVLIYPVTDRSFDTASYRENGEGYFLTTDMMEWFWDHYLPAPEDAADPLASPLRAQDVTGLPPAMVLTAEFDPLRDEGEAYAEKLRGAGVPVVAKRYDGQIHGFFNFRGVMPASKAALADVATELRKALT